MRAFAEQGNGRLPCKSTRPNAKRKTYSTRRRSHVRNVGDAHAVWTHVVCVQQTGKLNEPSV